VNSATQVVIVGAGIAGLTIAALLAQSEAREMLRITLLDAGPRPQHPDHSELALRVSAIATGSAELLDSVGAWPRVDAARIAAYDAMRVWDESSTADSGDALRFDAAEFATAQLGFIVENQMLQAALLGALQAESVELLFGAPVAGLQAIDGRQRLALEDGRKFDADLVIGADGARSRVRDCAEIETSDWQYHQKAFVTHLQPERPHDNTAWQRFLRSGPLGMLPLPDGRISVVWSTDEEQAQWAMQAGEAELGQALSEASDYVLGSLTVAGPRGAFDLRARHAQDYVKAGMALIGDAAHAIHPLAGQGANLGLQDASCLADVVIAAVQAGEYPGDRPVLRRYERARKGANASMMHFMTGLNRLFATDSALLKELLTTGMRLFNHSGPIREHVVSVALGTRR
jgi:2-octaprenylphenol hydroxylase